MADKDVRPGPVPADVLAYWRAKKLSPRFDWRDVWLEEHDLEFTAAKIMRRDVLAAMKNELDRAIADGVPFDRWAKQVEPRFREMGWWAEHEVIDPETGARATVDPPSRLRRIYDTNIRMARAVGQYDRAQKNKRFRPYVLYQVGPSHRHRPEHLALHGVMVHIDDPFWSHAWPPNGWGCFLPGTVVTGDFVGGSKAWYSGEAIEIKTDGGASLSVTPNHPILTSRGWVAAGSLKVGDDCVSNSGEVVLVRASGSPQSPGGAVRNQDVPACVEDVFKALSAHRRGTAQISPLDFHGEASRFVGQVDVVGTYVELADQRESTRLQFSGESSFPAPYSSLQLVDASGLVVPLLHPSSAARSRRKGWPGDFYPLVSRELPESVVCGFGSAAQRNVVSVEKAGNGSSGHSKFLGELQDRGSGNVSLDKVVSVRRFPYRGHVYDLETRSGWLLANGIAASNCKCFVQVLSAREADRIESEGIQAPDPEPILDDEGNPTGHVVDRRVQVRRSAPVLPLVPWENKRAGTIELVPQGIDPGFHYTPGEGRARALKYP